MSVVDTKEQDRRRSLQDLARKSDNVVWEGDGFRADCPMHPGPDNGSLTIQPDGKGDVLFHCSRGCAPNALREFIQRCQVLGGDEVPFQEQLGDESSLLNQHSPSGAFHASGVEAQARGAAQQLVLDAPEASDHDTELPEPHQHGVEHSSTQDIDRQSPAPASDSLLVESGRQPPLQPRLLPVGQIRRSSDLEPRASTCSETIEAYAQAYRDRAPIPPIVVFCEPDTDEYRLADGGHRLQAQFALGRIEIEAIVHPGDKVDAMLYAARSNTAHGLRRTPGDARKAAMIAILALLERNPDKRPTYEVVQAAAHVSRETVQAAYATLKERGVDVGAKDARGGSRKGFGSEPTKTLHEQAVAIVETASAVEDSSKQLVNANPANSEAGTQTNTDGDQLTINPREADAGHLSGDAIPGSDRDEVELKLPFDRAQLQAALDRAARLAKMDPVDVAAAIDVEFKTARIDPVITDLGVWAFDISVAIEHHARAQEVSRP
jgi:hypothetical protein